ncbi:unnamed protein product [Heterobilharzia americana]|nr:unnamed protein product [Heterobilharzia americana]
MIPFSDFCGNYSRVPPVVNTPNYVMPQNNLCRNDSSQTISHTTTPSRRGRRSNVPPEIREQTRRLKKQNMERKRRACISDKMNALHNLAMNLIGIDAEERHKVEKADILNLCHSVFQGIANIIKDEPELQNRLRKLHHHMIEESTSSTSVSIKLETGTSFVSTDTIPQYTLLDKNNQSTDHQNHYEQHPKQSKVISSFEAPKSQPPSLDCFSSNQNLEEQNKENKIPKLIIRNSSIINYKPVPDISDKCTKSSLSDNTPYMLSSSSIYSTPLNNLHSNNIIYSQDKPLKMLQCQSTPLQYTKKFNLSLNNSDSGIDSNQSIEVISDRKQLSISNELHPMLSSEFILGEISNKLSLSSSSMMNSPLLCDEFSSAFTIAADTLTTTTTTTHMIKSVDASFSSSNPHHYQSSIVTNSLSTSAASNTQTVFTSGTDTIPMWRPYLD